MFLYRIKKKENFPPELTHHHGKRVLNEDPFPQIINNNEDFIKR